MAYNFESAITRERCAAALTAANDFVISFDQGQHVYITSKQHSSREIARKIDQS
jgi:hypothetical protein